MNRETEGAIAPAPEEGASDERELWREWTEERSTSARERLFALLAPFALRIAHDCIRRWPEHGAALADARQLACVGLIEAIDRFDQSQGVPFSAYARKRIRNSVLEGLQKMSEFGEQIRARRRARRERLASLLADGPESDARPSTKETLQRLIEVAVGLALSFMLEGTGLYAPVEACEHLVYDHVAWRDLISRLGVEVAALPTRERTILQHHYEGMLTFEEIGNLLGLSGSRISQIHQATLTVLRKRFAPREAMVPE